MYFLVILPFRAGDVSGIRGDEVKAGREYYPIHAAFSDSTDIWCIAILSIQDQETMAVNLVTDTQRKNSLWMELMQELSRRNPKILCGQELVCDGRHYILERDGAQILRLYKEGRPLELAK